MARTAGGGLDLLQQARRGRREEERGRPQGEEGARPPGPSAARPEDESWRADALARSRHSRLDELLRPGGRVGDAAAESLCADLTRKALGDFSPALLLLPAPERRRAQALAAYAFTLFDFARQRGVEGERLAQINRWQFTLEATLGGEEPAQPVFVAMEREHRRRPWPFEALDELAAVARERVGDPIPEAAAVLERRRLRLAEALLEALIDGDPSPGVLEQAAALLTVRGLVEVGEELRQRRSPVAAEELPPAWRTGREPSPEEVVAAVRRAGAGIRSRLAAPPADLALLPPAWRRALAYLRLAGRTLLERLDERGEALLADPPRLGLGDRLRMLARARWRGR